MLDQGTPQNESGHLPSAANNRSVSEMSEHRSIESQKHDMDSDEEMLQTAIEASKQDHDLQMRTMESIALSTGSTDKPTGKGSSKPAAARSRSRENTGVKRKIFHPQCLMLTDLVR